MANPFLLLDPEFSHKIALWAVKNGLAGSSKKPVSLQKDILDIKFSSPIGLSAGADKEAYALSGWDKIGFGFVETGTVTLHARDGNPKPRVWRQAQENSVINWMGLPGGGLQVFLNNIRAFRAKHVNSNLVVGVSVASPEGNIDDLETVARETAPFADYLTLNASCPNVEHGSDDGDALAGVVSHVKAVCAGAGDIPVFLKLGPTRSAESLEATLKAALKAGAKGFVLTNTVPFPMQDLIGDVPFEWPSHNGEAVGGYSGPRLLDITKFMISHARKTLGPDVPLIGVGGIQSANDAKTIMAAGADLIQIYTGFIYKGPKLVRDINKNLA